MAEAIQSHAPSAGRTAYGDEPGPATRPYLERTAPSNNTSKMTSPLFVVAGRDDPPLPYTEGEQLIAKVRAQGGDVGYRLANDEGHGLRKNPNRDAQRAADILCLRKLLEPRARS